MAPFLTPTIPPKKFMWVPFLRSFPGNEAHEFFLGVQKGAFGWGAKKFMLKEFMCLFCPLTTVDPPVRKLDLVFLLTVTPS